MMNHDSGINHPFQQWRNQSAGVQLWYWWLKEVCSCTRPRSNLSCFPNGPKTNDKQKAMCRLPQKNCGYCEIAVQCRHSQSRLPRKSNHNRLSIKLRPCTKIRVKKIYLAASAVWDSLSLSHLISSHFQGEIHILPIFMQRSCILLTFIRAQVNNLWGSMQTFGTENPCRICLLLNDTVRQCSLSLFVFGDNIC